MLIKKIVFQAMNKVASKFLVFILLILGTFSNESCTSSKLVWSTSSGIVSYNRHTGEFELLWDNSLQQHEIKHDTVYICPEDTIKRVRK